MAFPNSPGLFKVTLGGRILDQKWANVFYYQLSPIPAGGADELALAFWNFVKVEYRSLITTAAPQFFLTVTVEHLGGDRAFSVYNIPAAERAGTNASPSDFAPSFMAAGVRLNVATRQTRPGQKRIPVTAEAFMAGQSLVDSFRTALEALGVKFVGEISLTVDGNPVIAVPVVVSFRPLSPTPVEIQKITSATANPNLTTQNTRKLGRGE